MSQSSFFRHPQRALASERFAFFQVWAPTSPHVNSFFDGVILSEDAPNRARPSRRTCCWPRARGFPSNPRHRPTRLRAGRARSRTTNWFHDCHHESASLAREGSAFITFRATPEPEHLPCSGVTTPFHSAKTRARGHVYASRWFCVRHVARAELFLGHRGAKRNGGCARYRIPSPFGDGTLPRGRQSERSVDFRKRLPMRAHDRAFNSGNTISPPANPNSTSPRCTSNCCQPASSRSPASCRDRPSVFHPGQ